MWILLIRVSVRLGNLSSCKIIINHRGLSVNLQENTLEQVGSVPVLGQAFVAENTEPWRMRVEQDSYNCPFIVFSTIVYHCVFCWDCSWMLLRSILLACTNIHVGKERIASTRFMNALLVLDMAICKAHAFLTSPTWHRHLILHIRPRVRYPKVASACVSCLRLFVQT